MALGRGAVGSNWKRRIIMVVGFTACILGIMMNLKTAKSKPDTTYFKERIGPQTYLYFEGPIVAETNMWHHIPVALPTQNCYFAHREGANLYPVDQITCDLHLKIPLFGHNEEVRVGAVAVFDGHNGMEASVLASRLFLDTFLLKLNCSTEQSSNYMELLKSSLVRTIEDIDAEFSKLADKHGSQSGSTAVVALIYNNHVLVANVGNSKAFLCSREMQSDEAGEGVISGLFTKELTRDHNAHRLDDRARVEASGGVFTFLGVKRFPPLLLGHFSVTRAIGHVSLKRFGIIASPEVTDWLPLISKDEFLVVTSDGILKRLTTQGVCDFLNKEEDHSNPSLLAQQLIQKESLRGNRDSLSVVLVPLRSGDLTV